MPGIEELVEGLSNFVFSSLSPPGTKTNPAYLRVEQGKLFYAKHYFEFLPVKDSSIKVIVSREDDSDLNLNMEEIRVLVNTYRKTYPNNPVDFSGRTELPGELCFRVTSQIEKDEFRKKFFLALKPLITYFYNKMLRPST